MDTEYYVLGCVSSAPLDTEHKAENKVLPREPATEVTCNSPPRVRNISKSLLLDKNRGRTPFAFVKLMIE